jgi:tetratricopeptide (TPR) repeat protein
MKVPLTIFTAFVFLSNISHGQSGFSRDSLFTFFQSQDFDGAISYLQPVAAKDSLNVNILGYLGYSNYMIQKFDEAERYYLKVIRIDSVNIAALQYLGALNGKNASVAIGYYQKLITLQPTKAIHYKNAAQSFMTVEQKDTAGRLYQQAYLLSPADARFGAPYASWLVRYAKNFSLADSIIRLGLEKDSLNEDFLTLAVMSAYEQKKYSEALEPGERYLRLGAINSVTTATQIILSYYNLEKYDDCIAVCTNVINQGIVSEAVYYYEAKALAKQDNFEGSNALLDSCLKKAISKTAELYYYTKAQNNESMKKFSAAVKNYDTAYYLFRDPLMKYNAGRVYEVELKDEAQAKRNYSIYLKKGKPSSEEERKAYEYVRKQWGPKKDTARVSR